MESTHRAFQGSRHSDAQHWINAAVESAVLLLLHRVSHLSEGRHKVHESVSRELLSRTIWKYSEAYGKFKGNRYWSTRALKWFEEQGSVSQFRHEHVFPQIELIRMLRALDAPNHETVLALFEKYAVATVVLKEEDQMLHAAGRSQSTVSEAVDNPWLRYDTPAGRIEIAYNEAIPEWHQTRIQQAGLLGKTRSAAVDPRRHTSVQSPTLPSRTRPVGPSGMKSLVRGAIDRDSRIELIFKGNPKKPGSATHQRFEFYKRSHTAQEYLDAGGTLLDVRWDAHPLRRFIELQPPER
jgi:hypothetical protein